MTDKEKEELGNIFNTSIYSTEYLPHETYTDLFRRKLNDWVESKKKEWQEEAKCKHHFIDGHGEDIQNISLFCQRCGKYLGK